MKNKNSWNQIKINFHSAFTTQCVSFTQSDSLTHPQGWRSQSQVYKICVSSKPWIRLYASLHHHPPADNLHTTGHKIRLSVSASPLPSNKIRLSVSASPPPIESHQNVALVAHSAPRFPTSKRSTHRHYERITTHHQQSATHTSSTVPTTSTFPILQESADSWSPSLIIATCQFHGNKRMNLTSLQLEPGLH